LVRETKALPIIVFALMGTDRRRQKESTKPVIEDAVADDLSPIINIKRLGQFSAKPLLDQSIQILQHSLVVQKCMLSVCGRRNSDNLGVIIDGKGDCFPGQLTAVSWRTWTKQGRFKRAVLAMDSEQTGHLLWHSPGARVHGSDGDPGTDLRDR
jgi:hypothetical protein